MNESSFPTYGLAVHAKVLAELLRQRETQVDTLTANVERLTAERDQAKDELGRWYNAVMNARGLDASFDASNPYLMVDEIRQNAALRGGQP